MNERSTTWIDTIISMIHRKLLLEWMIECIYVFIHTYIHMTKEKFAELSLNTLQRYNSKLYLLLTAMDTDATTALYTTWSLSGYSTGCVLNA
jgi:hypothetical protein